MDWFCLLSSRGAWVRAWLFRDECHGLHLQLPLAGTRFLQSAVGPSWQSWGGVVLGRGVAGRQGSWPDSGDSFHSTAYGWSRSSSNSCPRSSGQIKKEEMVMCLSGTLILTTVEIDCMNWLCMFQLCKQRTSLLLRHVKTEYLKSVLQTVQHAQCVLFASLSL